VSKVDSKHTQEGVIVNAVSYSQFTVKGHLWTQELSMASWIMVGASVTGALNFAIRSKTRQYFWEYFFNRHGSIFKFDQCSHITIINEPIL
jgi:hypothetical protein